MWKSKDKIKEYSRKRMKEKYDRWRKNKCCVKCSKPILRFTLCLKHRIYQANASKKYYAKKKLKEKNGRKEETHS